MNDDPLPTELQRLAGDLYLFLVGERDRHERMEKAALARLYAKGLSFRGHQTITDGGTAGT